MLGLLAFCLLVAAAVWAEPPALRRGLNSLVVIDLARRLCIVPGADERAASWAAGIAPPALVGRDRWQWAGGWAATLAWYAVTTWVVVVTLKREGPESQSSRAHPAPRVRRDAVRAPPPSSRAGVQQKSAIAWLASVVARLKNNGPALCQEQGRCRGTERNSVNPTLGSIPKTALLAPAVAVVALYLAYPWLRGWRIEHVAVAVYAIGLGVQLAAGTLASLRWHVPPAEERAAWLTGWILAVSTISSAAGAWALAHPIRDWYATRWLSVLTWAAVGGVHLWALTRPKE